MSVVKRLAAATVFAAALFAAPAPAEAQSGCELLYLKWEGCATECDSYYESTVLRAVCRGWCLVEYLYDYWTCESNVEGAAAEGDDHEGDAPEEEPVALLRGGATRFPAATAPPGVSPRAVPSPTPPAASRLPATNAPQVGEIWPTATAGLPGARRAIFRRDSLPRCADSSGPPRRAARSRAHAAAAPVLPVSITGTVTPAPARRRSTGAGKT